MKMYPICEVLNTDDIYILRDGRLLMHAEGEDARNFIATVYEHETVKQITPAKYGIEITIE
jgi:hydrogenase maturation factor